MLDAWGLIHGGRMMRESPENEKAARRRPSWKCAFASGAFYLIPRSSLGCVSKEVPVLSGDALSFETITT
jgi:hypothetical protein